MADDDDGELTLWVVRIRYRHPYLFLIIQREFMVYLIQESDLISMGDAFLHELEDLGIEGFGIDLIDVSYVNTTVQGV